MSLIVSKHFDFEVPQWAEFSRVPQLRIGYAVEVLLDEPVAYLRFSDVAGSTAKDISGNSHHGTFYGDVTYEEPGALPTDGDLSVKLPGAEGHIELPSGVAPIGSGARTVEAWFRIDSSPPADTFFNYGTAAAGSRVAIDVQSTTIAIDVTGHRVGATELSLTGWHHLAVVLPTQATSSAQWIVYLDAELLPTVTLSGSAQTVDTGDSTVYIGRHLTTTSSWSGWVDELAIYDTALARRRIESHVRLASGG